MEEDPRIARFEVHVSDYAFLIVESHPHLPAPRHSGIAHGPSEASLSIQDLMRASGNHLRVDSCVGVQWIPRSEDEDSKANPQLGRREADTTVGDHEAFQLTDERAEGGIS